MPEPYVEATFAASTAQVLAALTSRVAAQGWTLSGVGGFGTVVTWTAFDAALELVTLRAEVAPAPGLAAHTRVRVQRVDLSLDAALDAALAPSPVQPTRSGTAG